MTPQQNHVTASDVFQLFHLLIEADHDINVHELWMLVHEIAYPGLRRPDSLSSTY